MGLTLSKSTTPRELADYLEGLGPAYSRYEEAVLENFGTWFDLTECKVRSKIRWPLP